MPRIASGRPQWEGRPSWTNGNAPFRYGDGSGGTVLEPAAVDYLATVLDANARLRRFYRIAAEHP
ncbi:MAG: hypothetical protein VCA35_06590 [Roseibacillus sp.]